jgi:hypothetical protein
MHTTAVVDSEDVLAEVTVIRVNTSRNNGDLACAV